jgi:hypothetical protein
VTVDDNAPVADLEQFDGEFTPSAGGRLPNLEAVPPGDYDWTILRAELSTTPKTGDRILRLDLKCEQSGQAVQHVYFFRQQEQVNHLGGDLAVLGFPVGTWTPSQGKKFSAELPKAVGELPGRRFKGTRANNKDKADATKTYHNLYLNARLPDADPGTLAQATQPASQPANGGDEIPF